MRFPGCNISNIDAPCGGLVFLVLLQWPMVSPHSSLRKDINLPFDSLKNTRLCTLVFSFPIRMLFLDALATLPACSLSQTAVTLPCVPTSWPTAHLGESAGFSFELSGLPMGFSSVPDVEAAYEARCVCRAPRSHFHRIKCFEGPWR